MFVALERDWLPVRWFGFGAAHHVFGPVQCKRARKKSEASLEFTVSRQVRADWLPSSGLLGYSQASHCLVSFASLSFPTKMTLASLQLCPQT